MKPEDKARVTIDRMLTESGWVVQSSDERDIDAARGVASCSFRMGTNEADYLLYADGKAIGVVEAKKVGTTLTGIETQSAKYTTGLTQGVRTHRPLPLPFSYESTGEQTRFTNHLDPDARSREVFGFHRPEELLRLVALPEQLRGRLRHMPEINTEGMWPVQIDTVERLERSLADNRPRSLIRMATGSGKTFTAVSFLYRLIKFAGARRVLFLVDRTNLGKQTNKEFEQYRSRYTNYTFTEEYPVQHLRRNRIEGNPKVVITTIQRLYSILKGEPEDAEVEEDSSNFENAPALSKEPMEVKYNAAIPPEFFDFVVIDECHRSIYNVWRQVLDYFDAFLIGLTATPTGHTAGFFNFNIVQDYNSERAVADNVNVGFEVFRIETEITAKGGTIVKQAGEFLPRRDRRTLKKRYAELDGDFTYTANMLDRDVVSLNQIRTVIRTFRDCLPQMFPSRTEVPKTLIFAKTDLHAEDVVNIVREEFGKGNEFCAKITAKADDPDAMLKKFQNEHFPRVAVTVDMIATGTDVKPLECVVFLRMVKSLAYFEQMKGRGCRVATVDEMAKVNQDARPKTHFVIVDCVGVFERQKSDSKPLDRKKSVPFKTILEFVGQGGCDADTVSTLAGRLAIMNREVTPEQAARIEQASGAPLTALIGELLSSVNEDRVATLAAEKFKLPPDADPTEQQLDEVEAELMYAAVKPFRKAAVRRVVQDVWLELNPQEQVIDPNTEDFVRRAEFDPKAKENAAALVANFRQFCADNREQIEALQLLYSKPYRAGLRYGQVKELAETLKASPQRFEWPRVWQAFEIVEPAKVKATTGKQLADLIALVRHAIDPDTPLVPVESTVAERYAAWLAEREASVGAFTPDQRKWLDAIRDHIATSLRIERDDFADVPFNHMGGLGRAALVFGDTLDAILDELNTRLAA
jgi:type I restriction enzyme R subunit